METNAAAEDYYNDEAFRRAEALVEQLTLLGDLDRAGEELRTRRDQLVAAVDSERRDRDLILGIEEALMMRMGTGGGSSVEGMRAEVEKSFAVAFKHYGQNPAEAAVDETVAWLELRREEVRDRILAGMLEWADSLKENSPEDAGRLKAVVAALDPDPWREKLRRAIDEEDRAVLEQLAESEEISEQTIMTVLNLASAVREQGKHDEAIASYRKAIELEPDLGAAHRNLGTALMEQGRLDAALAARLESLRLEPNPQQQSAFQTLKEMDTQLLDMVREKGAGDPAVRALAREVYAKLEFRDPPQARVRGFWKHNREEVAEALGSVEVRNITILKNHPDDLLRTAESAKVLTHELARKLAAGADFGDLAKEFSDDGAAAEGGLKSNITWGEDLSEALDLAAFTLEVGAISEVIEVPKCYFLLKVEKREAGKADDFDDPKVREVAAALFKAQRRKKMEQAYLDRLQEQIEEEDANEAAKAKDAE